MDQLEVPKAASSRETASKLAAKQKNCGGTLTPTQPWTAIGAAQQQSGAFLIYLEGSLIIPLFGRLLQPEIMRS